MSDDDTLGDFWRDVKAARQQKRADNRTSSAELLIKARVPFEVKNGGAHLIVKADDGQMIDFWPGTGLWIVRGSTRRHGGVRKLIARCRPSVPGQHP